MYKGITFCISEATQLPSKIIIPYVLFTAATNHIIIRIVELYMETANLANIQWSDKLYIVQWLHYIVGMYYQINPTLGRTVPTSSVT